MSILRYLDERTGIVYLPEGCHAIGEHINESVVITSADPLKPATLYNKSSNNKTCLTLWKPDSRIENVLFMGEENAVALRGENQKVTYCQFKNNRSSITAEFKAEIDRNDIRLFTQDGIRFCGNGTKITNNTIGMLNLKKLVGKDQAHKDCIQGYAGELGSPYRSKDRYSGAHALKDVEIINNTLVDSVGSPLQGILIVDGRAEDWLVARNTIRLFNHHGITIRGSKGVKLKKNVYAGTAGLNLLKARSWVTGDTDDGVGYWEEIEDDYSVILDNEDEDAVFNIDESIDVQYA